MNREADITGSETDSAVEFVSELKPDRTYTFHLETDNAYRSSKWKFGSDGETTLKRIIALSVTKTRRPKVTSCSICKFKAVG